MMQLENTENSPSKEIEGGDPLETCEKLEALLSSASSYITGQASSADCRGFMGA
jgi:hypothetical protein